MSADAHGEVCATARTQVGPTRDQVCAQVVLVEARGAGNTFRDRVITAEYEEKDALLGAEVTRSLAVEMEELVAAERKGFIGRNGLTAARQLGTGNGSNPWETVARCVDSS